MAPRSTKQKTSDHQAMTREIQRRGFLWRTLSESGAGYILNNLHWEYDIIWPINMDISNIKILLNGVSWQHINYFMILSTIYWSNMSQRMRLLPEMLTGTLLKAPRIQPVFPCVPWVCPGSPGSPVICSRPQRQDNSDVDDAGWQSALPGLGGLCASLLLPLHVRCERTTGTGVSMWSMCRWAPKAVDLTQTHAVNSGH